MEQREFVVEQETAGQRIDRFLSGEDTGLSRSALQALVADGHVQCNGKTVAKSLKLKAGDTVQKRQLLVGQAISLCKMLPDCLLSLFRSSLRIDFLYSGHLLPLLPLFHSSGNSPRTCQRICQALLKQAF